MTLPYGQVQSYTIQSTCNMSVIHIFNYGRLLFTSYHFHKCIVTVELDQVLDQWACHWPCPLDLSLCVFVFDIAECNSSFLKGWVQTVRQWAGAQDEHHSWSYQPNGKTHFTWLSGEWFFTIIVNYPVLGEQYKYLVFLKQIYGALWWRSAIRNLQSSICEWVLKIHLVLSYKAKCSPGWGSGSGTLCGTVILGITFCWLNSITQVFKFASISVTQWSPL